jgi:hypothetical protein
VVERLGVVAPGVGDGTASRTSFRSKAWAGVRARGSPALVSGAGGACRFSFSCRIDLLKTKGLGYS